VNVTSLGALQLDAATDFVVTNALGGSGLVRKTGSGKVTLSGANSLSGSLLLNSGTLSMGNASALGSATLTIAAGASLDASTALTLNSTSTQIWNGSFTFLGSAPLSLGTGPVMLNASPTVTVSAGTLTVGGVISGDYGVSKAGPGTLVLTGANTYTGVTTVSAGTLVLDGPNALPASSALSVASGATVILQNGAPIPSYTGTGIVTFAPGSNAFVGGDDTTQILQITLTGTSSLTKFGSGSVTLSNVSSYTGVTSVQDGTLSVASLNKVISGMAASSLGAPTNALNGTIHLGTLGKTGTLLLTGTAQTTDRVINLAGTTGGGVLDQSGTGALVFTGSVTATGAGSKILTLQGSTAGTGEILGVISNNGPTHTTAVAKRGTGTWTLSGDRKITRLNSSHMPV
jgi:autotransporter-associated beta strand protein